MTFDKIFTRVANDLDIEKEKIFDEEDKYDLDANLGKTDIPDIWDKICKIAQDWSGYKGEEIFFIDDKKENLFAAAKFGWQTFLMDYKNPEKSCEEINEILL